MITIEALFLGGLVDKRFVNVRNNSTTSNGSFDQCIEFLVSTDGQLQMPRSDTLHLQILTSISCKLQYFCGQVLEYGCSIDSSCCTNSPIGGNPSLEQTVNTTHRKLHMYQ